MSLPIVFGAPSGVRAGVVADRLARNHAVLRTADLSAALAACRRSVPAAAVLPFPPGAGEAEVLRFLREHGRRIAVFLYAETRPFAADFAYQALAAGACAVFDGEAPHFADDLGRRLTRMLGDLQQRHEEAAALAPLFARHDLIGASPAMHDVFRRALKASRFGDLPVLIEGERGTPKRRLAIAILGLDPARVRMPFFALGCAELGRVLGSHGERWNDLLWAARGGTVFLDEIVLLNTAQQRVLLDVAAQRSAEVRLLAATERPAAELVGVGLLDAALAAWLSLFRIPLPSLRGRPEDIAAQARHILRTTEAGEMRQDIDFGPGVLEALQRQRWDGNTRQLEMVLRAALGSREPRNLLLLDDLPAWVREEDPDAPLPEPVPHPGDWVNAEPVLERAAVEFERRLLQAATTP
jgi:DNA-binding NtrC family response regulator